MRQVFAQVPDGRGEEAAAIAARHGAATLSRLRGTDVRGHPVEVLVGTVPNVVVEDLLQELERLGTIEAAVPDAGAFAFEPPAARPPASLVDVSPRSALEVFLAGRQATGSWRGFLQFAVAAGVVVWIGLYTETVYLLTAAMLLAPFAGPAMNTAIALTSGDGRLLRSSVTRYVSGVAVTAVASAVLALVVGQRTVTGLTTDVLAVSHVAILLPVAAGIAGGVHLAQSEHSSLVSGAAVGLLVAASLAPPAGALGVAVVLGRSDLVVQAAFLVALQLVGITAVATIVFRTYGLTARGGRFADRRRWLYPVGLGLSLLAAAALVAVQLRGGPTVRQRSLARQAVETTVEAVAGSGLGHVLEIDPHLPSQALPGPERLILRVDVERAAGEADGDLADRLARLVGDAVEGRHPELHVGVDVTVHPPP